MSIDYTGTFGGMRNLYLVDGTRELNEAINEELGISKEVEDVTNNVATIVKDYIDNLPH